METHSKIQCIRDIRPKTENSIELTTFAFLDIETTGLYPNKGARIREIALLDRQDLLFYWSNQVITKNLSLSTEISKALELLSNTVIVGHNVQFDLQFIAYEADRYNCKGPNVFFIDTLSLAREILNQQFSYKLENLIKVFDIRPAGPLHTAITDAKVTRALFWKLISENNIYSLKNAGLQRLNWQTF
jgi:DNA polymerase-3 subunit epsilon